MRLSNDKIYGDFGERMHTFVTNHVDPYKIIMVLTSSKRPEYQLLFEVVHIVGDFERNVVAFTTHTEAYRFMYMCLLHPERNYHSKYAMLAGFDRNPIRRQVTPLGFKWFFWDETGIIKSILYDTEVECRIELKRYCEMNLGL